MIRFAFAASTPHCCRNEALATQKATMNLLNHMHSFHTKQSTEAKQERIARMRRARSMPKIDNEEEVGLN